MTTNWAGSGGLLRDPHPLVLFTQVQDAGLWVTCTGFFLALAPPPLHCVFQLCCLCKRMPLENDK